VLHDLAAQVLPHAGRVAPGEEQRVEVSDLAAPPGHRRGELRRLLELAVERHRLGTRAQLAEHHPGQEQRIARRTGAGLGGEHHAMAGFDQELPWHGDLGDIEVAIRKRNEHVGHGAGYRTLVAEGYRRPRRRSNE
jgi:hypothetical protein